MKAEFDAQPVLQKTVVVVLEYLELLVVEYSAMALEALFQVECLLG